MATKKQMLAELAEMGISESEEKTWDQIKDILDNAKDATPVKADTEPTVQPRRVAPAAVIACGRTTINNHEERLRALEDKVFGPL